MTQQTRFFFEGEDQDTEDRLLSPNKYREALNARISTSSRDGVGNFEIMYGNRLVAYTLPAGTNRVIGQAENERLNSVVYLVWNSNENHSILEFFRTTETIQPVLAPIGGVSTRFLNFKNTKSTRATCGNMLLTCVIHETSWLVSFGCTPACSNNKSFLFGTAIA